MEWLQGNWIWIVLGVGVIALHMFGHGGHQRGHGGGGGRAPAGANDATDAAESGHTHPDASVPGAVNSNDPASRAASPTLADKKRHKHGG